jgi:PKD repeat protein
MCMNRIAGYFLMIMCCIILLAGLSVTPVSAAFCDGPPNSQSFILFSGGCDRSALGLPCTQGFIIPAQPSPAGDFPTQYYLDFGDGSAPYYGTVDGVTHTYTKPGRFTLSYMSGTQCDLWRQASYVLDISAPVNYTPVTPACPPTHPIAEFIATPVSGFAPLTVQFTSTSTGADAYVWKFGDGATSPAQEPVHTYRTPGTYQVSLEARDACTGEIDRIDKPGFVSITTPAGSLEITSTPDGALVFIDNSMKGITPVTLTDTATGNYMLLIRKEGYDDYTRTISIGPSTPAILGVTLTRSVFEPTVLPTHSFGSIAVTSYPPGAAVFLDGRLAGTTPTVVSGVATGIHEITLSLRGFDNQSHIVSVGSGQTAAINAGLAATPEITGALAVITEPAGAEIYIDGTFKGVSPGTITGISAGTHTILLTLKDYDNSSTNLSITAGETGKLTTTLEKGNRPSFIDILLAAGTIAILGIIALLVMFRKDTKAR